MGVSWTPWGDRWAIHTNTESLCCTPGAGIISCQLLNFFKKNQRKNIFQQLRLRKTFILLEKPWVLQFSKLSKLQKEFRRQSKLGNSAKRDDIKMIQRNSFEKDQIVFCLFLPSNNENLLLSITNSFVIWDSTHRRQNLSLIILVISKFYEAHVHKMTQVCVRALQPSKAEFTTSSFGFGYTMSFMVIYQLPKQRLVVQQRRYPCLSRQGHQVASKHQII